MTDQNGNGMSNGNSMYNSMNNMNQTMSPSSMDMQITQNVQSMLSNDNTLSSNAQNLMVSTMNGNVTLQGSVANMQEKNKVIKMVKGVQGVKSVNAQQVMMMGS